MPGTESHMSKSLVTMITIVGGLVGAIAGGTGMWFTLKDRMEKQIETRVTRVSILPRGEPLFSEKCMHITIEDDSGGEFVRVQQQSMKQDADEQSITIDPAEWTELKAAIGMMIENCRKEGEMNK